MCGIAGLIHKTSEDVIARRRTLGAMDRLRHRGPDAQGMVNINWLNGYSLTLGHRRLSIIDLGPGGAQPIESQSKRFTLVFNGEIYNYREIRANLVSLGCIFQTNSDTEVLLQAWETWGKDSLDKLEGMFSFAITDAKTGLLTLVRDAFGIKPLFYSLKNQEFMFSSEIPSLLALDGGRAKANLEAARRFLEIGHYDDSSQTFVAGVQSVLPGHLIEVQSEQGRLALEDIRWFDPVFEPRSISRTQASSEIRDALLDAVRLNMRSDVEVGAALSGGLDSTSVVAAMRYIEPNREIKTFSFVSPGQRSDESKWSTLAAQSLGVRNYQVFAEPGSFENDISSLIKAQGEPFGSTSIYAQFKVFERARQEGVTVTLDGQGADELFAGYHGYPASRFRSLAESRQYIKLLSLSNEWAKWPGRDASWARLVALQSMVPRLSKLPRLRKLARRFVVNTVATPTETIWNSEYDVFDQIEDQVAHGQDYIGRRLIENLVHALGIGGVTQLLRHADRNSMHWSIESRVPFLTHNLTKKVLSLPEEYLLSSGGETKSIFREAMAGLVPEEIRIRRDKVGFEAPNFGWDSASGYKSQEFNDIVSQIPFMNRVEINRLANGMTESHSDWTLWRAWSYAKWWSELNVSY